MFLEQAYNTVKSQTFKANQKGLNASYQFQNDSSWPLPFKCLKENQNLTNEDFKIENLDKIEFSEIKKAVDKRFFQSIYDSFEITDTVTNLTDNGDGTTNVEYTIKYKYNPSSATQLANHYFQTKYSATKDGTQKFIEIIRKNPKQSAPKDQANKILNYIGQRLPTINIKVFNEEKNLLIGAPLNSKEHCSGKLAKRENFLKYCLTHENTKGASVLFKRIENKKLNGLEITPTFRISNSYLLRLPKNQKLMK